MAAGYVASIGSIILVNLVLSGDNAVVIAMAVRPLPPAQRRKGILLGAGAAVLLRILFTFFVGLLLQVPFVKLGGGLLILWIAVKLFLTDEEEGGTGSHAGGVFDAVKLIVVADITMSLDNMLAVGGISNGDPVLLGIGLAISIPFVIFASDLLSRLMDRYVWIVYLGAAILGKVSADMILTDPFTDARLHLSKGAIWVADGVIAVGVVVLGKVLAARAAARDRSVA